MSLNILRLIALLPLIKGLEAQFLSEPEARLQAWRAYGSFVQQSITAGVALTPGKDMVYITPPNFATVRGGTPCPDEITNYELFSLVDRLQNGSEPLLDLTGPSYAEALLTYVDRN